jgi:hypothetical protein
MQFLDDVANKRPKTTQLSPVGVMFTHPHPRPPEPPEDEGRHHRCWKPDVTFKREHNTLICIKVFHTKPTIVNWISFKPQKGEEMTQNGR